MVIVSYLCNMSEIMSANIYIGQFSFLSTDLLLILVILMISSLLLDIRDCGYTEHFHSWMLNLQVFVHLFFVHFTLISTATNV